MSFKIASNLSLPKEFATQVLAFLAKRGAGKTYDAADLAEEMLKAGLPIVVIDGMGVWWGLRVSKNGKGPGLPIVVFGGEHADLPLVPDKAAQIARAVVESNISCVLDLSGFSKGVMKRILSSFLDELYKINRMDRHVFLEEADMFAPQRPFGPEETICLGSVDNFVRRGGNHNLGVTMITQRSAVLNKNILTQADCLVILRTLAPQDKKAIQAWVEEMTDEDRAKLGKWFDSLKSLENGEAWIWHPEPPTIYKKVQFRERETFHATRENLKTPEAAHIQLMDVGDFITKFKNVFEPKPKSVQNITPSPIIPERIVKTETEQPIVNQAKVFPRSTVIDPRPSWGNEPKTLVTRNDGTEITQALPNLIIRQYKPDLGLTVEMLDQPTTPLGRVAVVLYNDQNNPGKWSINRIVKDIQDHGWDAADTGEIVTQFLRWEILTKDASGMMRVHRDRITVVNHTDTLRME